VNPLWVPPWKTIEPFRYRSKSDAARYGPLASGKLLSGLAGHNICLDRFGLPPEREAECGLSMLGEAPCSKWRKSDLQITGGDLVLTLSVELPAAGLDFTRAIRLSPKELGPFQ
jgi:hypothetical protein